MSREWLVKSSGKVKGPYTFEEVSEQIQTKETILVDEVARTFGRWKYVRDEEAFERVILEMKNQEELRGEKTFTNSVTEANTQDVSEHILSFSRSDQIKDQIQEHFQDQDSPEEEYGSSSSQKAVETPPASYVFEEDPSFKKELKKKGRYQIIGVLSILCSLVAFYYYQNITTAQNNFELNKKQAIRFFELSQFEDSSNLIERLLKSNSDNSELLYYSAYNKIYLGKLQDSEESLRNLEKQNSKFQFQVYNLLGIIQLKNYNLNEAKDFFNKSIRLNPKFVPAYYNLGIIDFLENKYFESYQNFQTALRMGGADAIILLMKIEILLSHGEKIFSQSEFIEQLEATREMVQKHINKFEIYKQELWIGLAVLNTLLSENEGIGQVILKSLSVDPDLTSQHMIDVSFYRDVMNWGRFQVWIKFLKKMHPSNEDISTLYGYSLFQGLEKIEGKSYIEGRLEPTFSRPIDHIINAYILWSLHRHSDSEVALMSLPQSKWNAVAYNLKGHLCLNKGDLECSRESYESALKIDPKDVVALVGIAQVFKSEKNETLANEMLNEVFNRSPYFRPMLNLKYELEYKK